MASVVPRDNGFHWIQFRDPFGKRKTLRLGKVSRKNADRVLVFVEDLLQHWSLRVPITPATAAWLKSLHPKIKKRLAAVGLCDYTPPCSVGELVEAFFGEHDFNKSTRTNIGISLENLKSFFGNNAPIETINTANAKSFKRHLKASGGLHGKPLAEASVSRRFRHVQQLFKFAVDSKMLPENPFLGIQTGSEANRSRDFFITREVANRIVEACDPELAAIFALARFGGLRLGEIQSFEWAWADFSTKIITVKKGKTGARVLPMFGCLHQWLKPHGGEAAFPTYHKLTATSWRKRLKAVLSKLEISPWPKLFQNLRASRATELRDKGIPGAVASQWLGHSAAVADKHYVQATQEHFLKAIETAI